MYPDQLKQEDGLAIPLEKLSRRSSKAKRLRIGVPLETDVYENRVALNPFGVQQLVDLGFEVYITSDAGKMSNFSDELYADAGAIVCDNNSQVFNSDIVLKLSSPTIEEVGYMKERAFVFSFYCSLVSDKKLLRAIIHKKLTVVVYDEIRDSLDSRIVVRLMSEIAGTALVGFASMLLASPIDGKGRCLGGFATICPTNIVILGAGVLAEHFIRPLMSMGVSVQVFDHSILRIRRLNSRFNSRISTSLYDETLVRKALRSADIVLSAMPQNDAGLPFFITQEWQNEMEKGSVILDLNINSGGGFENVRSTTLSKPSYIHQGLQYLCLPNLASSVPNTASTALSNYFVDLLRGAVTNGDFENMLIMKSGLRKGVAVYQGYITHAKLAESGNFIYKDIDLLLALMG